MKHRVLIVLLGMTVLPTATVQAEPIIFNFTVRIDTLVGPDAAIRYAGVTTAFGTITFDSNATDLAPNDDETGIYRSVGVPFGMTLRIGDDTYEFDDLEIRVFNNATEFPPPGGNCCFDMFDATELSIASVPPFSTFGIALRSPFNTDPGPFTSDALPLLPPDLSLLPIGNAGSGGASFALSYDLDAGSGGAFGLVLGTVIEISARPQAPTITAVRSSDGALSIDFTAGDDGGVALTNYEYSTTEPPSWLPRSPASTASPLVITGLTNGVSYPLRLRAVNANGVGPATEVVRATPSTTPDAPAVSGVAASSGQLIVAFVPGGTGGSPITNYQYSLDGGPWISRAPAEITSPLVIGGLTNGRTYQARLRATNVNGDGTPSPPLAATVLPSPDETVDGYNPAADDGVLAIALTSNGRVLVGGAFRNIAGHQVQHLARLNADGSIDTTFGALGIADDSHVTAIALPVVAAQAGKIVVSTDAPPDPTDPIQQRRFIGRLETDGAVDLSFESDANASVFALAPQPDGKVVIGGAFTTLSGTNTPTQDRPHLARLNADGSVDLAFNPRANGDVAALVLQPDGKILVGGSFTAIGGAPRVSVARLHADGSVDLTFDTSAIPLLTASTRALVVQPDGKIVAGGRFITNGGEPLLSNIIRLTPDGTLDSTFAIAPRSMSGADASSTISSMVVLPDGRLLFGGNSVGASTAEGTQRHLARLHQNGTLDTNYNPNPNGPVSTLTVQSDGRVLVGGQFTSIGGRTRYRLARLRAGASVSEPFTDDPILGGSTIIKAIHVVELRRRVNALERDSNTMETTWTDPDLTGVPARAMHIQQLRDAVLKLFRNAVEADVRNSAPVFLDDPLSAQEFRIRAVHIEQLRAAVRILETADAAQVPSDGTLP